jgi:DNA polymerase I-like protein with 3'-5' exonuclease and polymerase domains
MTNNLQAQDSLFKMKLDSANETWLVFDLESDNLYDSVTIIHCIVLYDIGRKQTFTYGPDSVADALAHLATADVLIGHNIIFYDLPVLQKLHQFTSKARIIDTLICTRLIWPKETLYELDLEQYPQVPPKNRGAASLKAWGWRLADHKIDFKDFSVFSEEMLKYCVQDVEVTKKLWEHICKQHYPQSALKLEHDFALAINRQIRSGVPFDYDAAFTLVDVLRTRKEELESELKKHFPPIEHKDIFIPKVNNKTRGYVKGVPYEKIRIEEFNPGSRQQIADRLEKKYGWRPEKTTEKGNPILDDDVLETLPYPEAKPLAEYMLIKKRLGQLVDGNNAWIKLFNTDTDRIHGDLITNGCITGRCAHRNPNMGQVPASYSPYGHECRNLFHAPYGWDLIGIDAKALELRCLAGYLALWDDGEYAALVVNPEVDIHTYNQEQFGVATRDISKRLLYGMLYGCGAAKAGTIIDPDEKNPEKLAAMGKAAINGFMTGVPALKKLKQQIDGTIGSRGYLRGLDRRILHCRSAFKGLNVLLQSAGAILMKQVVVLIHDNIEKNLGLEYGKDWEQLLMVHDEVQIACHPDHTEAIREQAMLAFPQAQEFFNFNCLIEGDSRVGSTWADTH